LLFFFSITFSGFVVPLCFDFFLFRISGAMMRAVVSGYNDNLNARENEMMGRAPNCLRRMEGRVVRGNESTDRRAQAADPSHRAHAPNTPDVHTDVHSYLHTQRTLFTITAPLAASHPVSL
jgi:hypothetical protein